MRKEFTAFVSAMALMSGAALAQSEDQNESGIGDEPGDTISIGDYGTEAMLEVEGEATMPEPSGAQINVAEIVGEEVMDANGEPLGEVSGVVVNSANGEILQLVVASGGFLGMDTKDVAVDVTEAEIRADEGIFLSSTTQEDVAEMPEFIVEAE